MLSLAIDNTTPADAVARRRALLAKVHIARKQLGIQEDDYRALLARVTGRSSAGDCDARQLGLILAELERMGFRATTARRAPASSPTAKKARAMWISLGQLGAVADQSEAALEAFGKRQLGVERLQWADERQGYRLIEALKAIGERYGWAQKLPSRATTAERVRLLKDRLVGAQLARLAAAGVAATGPIAADRASWSNKRLENAAAELAARIRSLPADT